MRIILFLHHLPLTKTHAKENKHEARDRATPESFDMTGTKVFFVFFIARCVSIEVLSRYRVENNIVFCVR